MQLRAQSQFKNGIRITDPNIHRLTLKSPLMEMCFLWTFFIALMLCHQLSIAGPIYKDDPCETKSMPGVCKKWSECSIIKTLIDSGEYTKSEVLNCGFDIREELICCPAIRTDVKIKVTTATTVPNPKTGSNERPAARACKRILKGLYKGLIPLILGGTPAALGEFPHMVALGYSRLGDAGQGPYDIRCGGTLIDSQFVLTAAHCVAARDSVPAIARMGAVNFSDPNAMQDAVEIKIKDVFIHDAYATSSTYNDVALLQLERPAPLGEFIHPVCLYTDRADPDTSIKLWVTGWGTINTSTRAFSDILLKAPLHVTPIDRCNASFVDYGLTRQIKEGIISTQLCAEDKDQIRDTCQGDSGGPLNLIVDESIKEYRLVGIVASGFGCASSVPGLYTRVAAFLEFIEGIVWPNGGD